MFINDMAQESEALLTEFALLWIQSHSCCLDLLEGGVQSCVVLLLVLSKDEHIIHMAKNTLLSCKDLVHSVLKVLRGTENAKGQFIKTVAPKRCDKHGEGPGTLVQGDLPEAGVGIQFAEYGCSGQLC